MAIYAHQIPATRSLLTRGNAGLAVQLAAMLDKPGLVQLTAEVSPEAAECPAVRGIGVTRDTFWYQVEVFEENRGPAIVSTEAIPLQMAIDMAA